MGIIDKRISRRQTAPDQVPTKIPVPYLVHGVPFVAGVLRGVALSVGETSASLGNLWLEQDGFRRWFVYGGYGSDRDVVLRLDKPNWKLQVDIVMVDGAEHARISTPFYRTRDGALIDADEYVEVRDLLTTGLTAGRLPRADVEVDHSEKGLRFPSPPLGEVALLPLSDHFAAVTQLDVVQVERFLAAMPFPRKAQGENCWLWRLDAGGSTCTVTATVADDGSARRIDGTISAAAGDSPVADLRAVRRAQCYLDCFQRLLAKQDQAATVSGGDSVRASVSIEAL